ncbi:MAG: manganese efflux pump [Clostridia bacterium]|jgi:putative Mn2+ efflux pump MntP|nr:manganese efflux pump [Clostridia bacterium]
MGILEILLISIGLAMDAFAVSICKGLSIKDLKAKNIIIIGLYFGIFQAGMPLIGFLLGKGFESFVTQIDHWIAFGLLSIIGVNMILETLKKEENINSDIGFKTMILLAIATSIDALAVGITFAFLEANIIGAIFTIGIVTFVISALGVMIGSKFGDKFEKKAQILGGIILIGMGIHILIEHLFL